MGKFLRNRYNSLISPNYRREELYIRSTDRDRTLLSAVANLGSFYNVSSAGFVPFPVHTVPIKDDKILRMPVTGCNKYDQIKHELTATPQMEALNEKYRGELDKLGELGKSEEPLKVHTCGLLSTQSIVILQITSIVSFFCPYYYSLTSTNLPNI